MYIYVCVYIYMYIYIYIHVYICIYIYVALIGCCKIIYRAFSVVIFFLLVWMRRLAAGMGVGVRSMPTGSFG